ncbi:MAG TPA: nucleotide exchange factor GrpE [Candidatus Limnocylindrales bacterium]|nr:nucleotide exchange factor GrpE [Candidatus Limnocylindrales bacterium]
MSEQHRRHQRSRAEERIASLDVQPSTLVSEVESVKQQLDEARREAADNRAGWQRSAADFANFRRRSEQEREATLGLANEMLLAKLLAVVDDFDRALASMPRELEHLGWIEGLWLVERKLRALLESEGVTPIEAVGKPFDPREHEAAIHEETAAAPEGQVTGEIQRGYRIRDRVLRPALVKVAKNTAPDATRTSTQDTNPGGIH